MSPSRRSMLLMGAFVALWAVVEALASRALQRYSGYEVVWTRYVVHLALMVAVWGLREPRSLWRTRRPAFQFARSTLMLCMPACFIISLRSGEAPSLVLSIFWVSPLLLLVFARAFLGELAPRWIWLATAIACAGAFLDEGPSRLASWPQIIFPLGMAVSFSLYVVMTRSLRSETTRANLFYTALGVAALLSPVMPGLWITPPMHDLLVMAGVGILGFLGLYALDRLTAIAPVSVSAPVAYLQLAFSSSSAWLLGHELPTWRAAVGLMLVAAPVLVVWVRSVSLSVAEAA